jgi:hypothetical protein
MLCNFVLRPAVNLPNDRHASLEKSTFNTLSRRIGDVNVALREVYKKHGLCSLPYFPCKEVLTNCYYTTFSSSWRELATLHSLSPSDSGGQDKIVTTTGHSVQTATTSFATGSSPPWSAGYYNSAGATIVSSPLVPFHRPASCCVEPALPSWLSGRLLIGGLSSLSPPHSS